MWRVLLVALVVAGCAPIPPSSQEINAKAFEPVPGKAVIYIVRAENDSREVGTLILDDQSTLASYKNTFYRWVVDPGRHRVAGYAGDSSVAVVDTQPGGVYFVEYKVYGSPRTGWSITFLQQVDPQLGRRLVTHSQML